MLTLYRSYFFELKTQGTSDLLHLKCRLVPHGNFDNEMFYIRKDAVTAQFQVIPFLFTHAARQNRRLVSVDIKSAFLQALGIFTESIY